MKAKPWLLLRESTISPFSASEKTTGSSNCSGLRSYSPAKFPWLRLVRVQVLEWTQTILAAGEAFCGSESATLRDALRRQSGRFFAAFHSANLQVRTRLPHMRVTRTHMGRQSGRFLATLHCANLLVFTCTERVAAISRPAVNAKSGKKSYSRHIDCQLRLVTLPCML